MNDKLKPGRPRTGSVTKFRDERGRIRYRIDITLPDGKRQGERLPPGTWEAKAYATRDAWVERAAIELATEEPTTGETVEQWVERWLADRKSRGIQTDVDRGRLKAHVLPTLGLKLVAE